MNLQIPSTPIFAQILLFLVCWLTPVQHYKFPDGGNLSIYLQHKDLVLAVLSVNKINPCAASTPFHSYLPWLRTIFSLSKDLPEALDPELEICEKCWQ